MSPIKEYLLSRSDEDLIQLATDLAVADNDLRWALIQARKETGLSQREIASFMGVSQASVSQFERAENDPHLSTLRRYALAVGAQVAHCVTTESSVFRSEGWTQIPVSAGFAVQVDARAAATAPLQISVAGTAKQYDFAVAA